MKKILSLLVIILMVTSCKNDVKSDETSVETPKTASTKEMVYQSYGNEISDTDALSAERMLTYYKDMKVGDTLNAKMKGEIKEVCSKKGCWMKLDMGNNQMVRVTFKDYGFFMPLEAEGEVIINGKAFVKETSVADLKHYAEDAGNSPEEIAKITEPEITYAFEADGVLLNK